jgi:hypothetical protein
MSTFTPVANFVRKIASSIAVSLPPPWRWHHVSRCAARAHREAEGTLRDVDLRDAAVDELGAESRCPVLKIPSSPPSTPSAKPG